MKLDIKSKKGTEIITTPIIIALGILMVAVLIVFSIKIIMPYIWYEKLSSTCLKYVFIMEEYGYLTNLEEKNLMKELKKQGFMEKKVKVNCTKKQQKYGYPIYLNVSYTYELERPVVGKKQVEMTINRESVSKR